MKIEDRFQGWRSITLLIGAVQLLACQAGRSIVDGLDKRNTSSDPAAKEDGGSRFLDPHMQQALGQNKQKARVRTSTGSVGSGVASPSTALEKPAAYEHLAATLDIATAQLEEPQIPSWEEYKSAAKRTAADGTVFYVAEWDLALNSEEELRAQYDRANPAMTREKAAVHTLVGGSDDIWDKTEQLNISYCVLTGSLASNFGFNSTEHPDVVATMAEAADAWEQVANVRFTYVPSEDSDCYNASEQDRVTFSVVNASAGDCYAAAYLPSQARANKNDGNTSNDKLFVAWATLGTQTGACKAVSLLTKSGVLTHELGHVIGFVHEMQFAAGWPPNPNNCLLETSTGHLLTDYDQRSIMHYPWTQCLGDGTTVLDKLTASDGVAARKLYGMPAAWYVAIL